MTDKEKRDQAADIGDDALDLEPGPAREAFIDAITEGDPLLAEYVRKYLADLKKVLATRQHVPRNQPAGRNNPSRSAAITLPHGLIDGRYRLVRQLGVGGMGRVFRAIEIETGRPVAIKLIRSAQALSEDARMRFVREARAVSGLQHPNIVAVHDIGQFKGMLYIVMEYVRGYTLDVVAAQANLLLGSKLSIIAGVCDALGYAHARGIVHRDVKPANILVLHDQSVKVVDFGIAEQADIPNSLVQGGGTVLYMSPEQFGKQSIDGRSDIWSTGVTLFVVLTGKLPYRRWQDIIASPAPALPQGFPLTIEINAILSRALAKDPAARYANADEFGADLRRLLKLNERSAVPANPVRTAESFVSGGTYVLPDLNFSFPTHGELTTQDGTLDNSRARLVNAWARKDTENTVSDRNTLFRQFDDRSPSSFSQSKLGLYSFLIAGAAHCCRFSAGIQP